MPPGAPSNLVAVAVSGTQINLTWSYTPSGETALSVWRASGGRGFVLVGVVGPGSTSYQDRWVTPGTSYTYEVRAVNDYVASPWSNLASATTPAG